MSFISAFGYHSSTSIQSTPLCCQCQDPSKERTLVIILNVLGYIPVLGIIAGGARLLSAISNWSYDAWRPFNYAMITRGVLEVIGAGILLLIPDIIVSIGRHLCSNASSKIA